MWIKSYNKNHTLQKAFKEERKDQYERADDGRTRGGKY